MDCSFGTSPSRHLSLLPPSLAILSSCSIAPWQLITITITCPSSSPLQSHSPPSPCAKCMCALHTSRSVPHTGVQYMYLLAPQQAPHTVATATYTPCMLSRRGYQLEVPPQPSCGKHLTSSRVSALSCTAPKQHLPIAASKQASQHQRLHLWLQQQRLRATLHQDILAASASCTQPLKKRQPSYAFSYAWACVSQLVADQ